MTCAKEVCHDTVRALLLESMHAATIEDMGEMNALEYAIMSDATLRTVQLLQKASCKTLKPYLDPVAALALCS